MFRRKHEQHSGQKNLNSKNKHEQYNAEFCFQHENTDCHEKNTHSQYKIIN